MNKIEKLVVGAFALVGMTTSVNADTYTLVNLGSSSSPVEFSDPANWTVNGAAATTCPQPGDTILFGTADTTYYAHLALDGDYTISGITQAFNIPCLYRSANASADVVSLTFTGNVGGSGYQYYYANGGTKLVFAASSALSCAIGDWNESHAYATQTGEIDVLGSLTSRHMNWYVSDSATLYFAPTSYTQTSDSGRIDDNFSITGGCVTFQNGLAVTGGNSSFNNTIAQSGGTVTFGGDFTSVNSPWTYTFSGGTLATTANCAFGGNVSLVIPASASVTLDVASGTTFSAANFNADSTSTIVKNGGGTFAFAPTTAPITVNDGAIGLSSAATYDLSNISLGSGVSASIALTALGARVDSLPNALAGATFSADLSGASAGTVVFYSTDDTILAKVKDDLAVSVPAGFELVANGDALSLEVVSDYIFNASGNLISSTTSWNTGSLPGDNLDVAISGNGVVAEYTGGTIPAWTSIEVKNGATLKISVDCDLPPITLNKDATLEIASGASFLTNGITCVVLTSGGNVTLPKLVVNGGATLNVPANTKFKNIDMRLFGTISETGKGFLYFGHAESGETTYFAMNATNATISTIGSSSTYAQGQLWIACSEVGGAVSVMRRIELNGVTLNVSKYDGMYIGSNNPTSMPFDVLLENITKEYRGYWAFCGAATVTFRGCAFSRPAWQAWSAQGKWNVLDAAKLIYEDTTHFYEYPDGNSVNWSPVASGTECFVLTNSTVMWTRPTGNYNGVMTVFDSFYDCAYDAYAPAQGQTLPDLMKGLGALNIPEGAFCAIRAKDHVTWDANDDATERICKIDSRTKFTGAGDLVVSNSVAGRYFEVTMQSGENTCTGTLTTCSPENFNAKFYFADGANWAGTVVAGNVALTNLTDGASAATATFGTLDLAVDFPVRVWKTGGVVTTNDVLNVDSYTGAATIALVEMGEALVPGDKFVLGKIKSTGGLPKVGRHFSVKAGVPDENGYCDVTAKYSQGFQVIIR